MNAISQNVVDNACCTSCASVSSDADKTGPAIACSLGAADFEKRADGIQALARRSLLASWREPLRLHLTYGPEALAEVQDLVAKEAECCAFLDFHLRHDVGAVELTITAPVAALMAIDELFAHFAPHLARKTT